MMNNLLEFESLDASAFMLLSDSDFHGFIF